MNNVGNSYSNEQYRHDIKLCIDYYWVMNYRYRIGIKSFGLSTQFT